MDGNIGGDSVSESIVAVWYYRELQAEVTRLRGLLRRADGHFRHSGCCQSCEMIFENVYRHADDCELAKELEDE